MNLFRTLGAVVVALAVVAAVKPAAAQLSIGGMNLEGDVEAPFR